MPGTRFPAVAGLFYPSDQGTLKHDIKRYLDEADEHALTPKALIVPHAGYVYSGPIAASAYKTLLPLHNKIHRVVLFGPSHRFAFSGMAVPESDAFETPLGTIPLDREAIEKLTDLPYITRSNLAHQDEHSLEVQLPFLQEVLDEFSLVPVVISQSTCADVARAIELFLDDEETLIVISSDLSHYHEYHQAQTMDSATSDAIIQLQPERIDYEDACGRTGINGLLTVARNHQLKAEVIDQRNSGDTAGDKSRVVGYGAYVFH